MNNKKTEIKEDCLQEKTILSKIKKRNKNKPVKMRNLPTWEGDFNIAAGDNNMYLQLQVELYNFPLIDMHNPDEVNKRIGEYFMLYAKYNMRPTVSGMAIALNGMSRQTLSAIVHDKPLGSNNAKSSLPTLITDQLKKAYFLLENLWESYMVNGKVNPVVGIFLGKNNYGYRDQTDYVIAPTVKEADDYSFDEIKSRYLSNQLLDDKN